MAARETAKQERSCKGENRGWVTAKSARGALFLRISNWSEVNGSNYQLGLTTKIYPCNQCRDIILVVMPN